MTLKKATGTYMMGDFALVGMKFFQTPKADNRCKLRAHFIESIYDTAWNQNG